MFVYIMAIADHPVPQGTAAQLRAQLAQREPRLPLEVILEGRPSDGTPSAYVVLLASRGPVDPVEARALLSRLPGEPYWDFWTVPFRAARVGICGERLSALDAARFLAGSNRPDAPPINTFPISS